MKKAASDNEHLPEDMAFEIFRLLPYIRKCLFRVERILSQHHLLMSHIQILSLLSISGVSSVSEISRKLNIAKPNITLLVDRLIAEGYVARVRDSADRRVVDIVLLDEGRKVIKSMHKSLAKQLTVLERNNPDLPMTDFANAIKFIGELMPRTVFE